MLASPLPIGLLSYFRGGATMALRVLSLLLLLPPINAVSPYRRMPLDCFGPNLSGVISAGGTWRY